MTAKIGRFEIKSELGHGGMSTVYLAYDPQFKREVAIKVLPPELLHDREFRLRFTREATTIAALEHQSIVPVYDFGENGDQPYLVMRYFPHGSLKDRIARAPLPLDEVVRILNRIAPALDYAHQKGIIHRDLKPDNILFDQNGDPWLTDFGIAKLTESGATLTGNAIVGTPAYMSPEQGRGDSTLDGRSDTYSLGVILFEMLAGRVPFEANAPMAVVLKHLKDPVPNICEVRPDLPAACQAVLNQAMAKRSYVRYATAGDLAAALAAVARGEELPSNPAGSDTIALPREELPARPEPGKRTPQPRKTPTPLKLNNTPPPRPAAPGRKPARRWALFLPFLLLLGAGFGGYRYFNGGMPFPGRAPQATALELAPAGATATGAAVVSTQALKRAETPPPTPAITPAPTATPQPAPSPTPQTTPDGVLVGAADQLAFVAAGDIWTSDLDGQDLQRLTTNGGAKTGLQWAPDGGSVTFISGRCVQVVDIATKALTTVLCMPWADSIGGFEVSPGGDQVALSSSYGLFILPYDLQALKAIRTKAQLDGAERCLFYNNSDFLPFKGVRWSNDGKSLALHAAVKDLGRTFDQIVVMDVSLCGQAPVLIDQFPHKRFDDVMKGYFQKPEIIDFAWDGDLIFALNVNTVNGFGEIYTYNMSSHKAAKIDPLNKRCCYRSFRWSPDLINFFFAFQDWQYGGPPQVYFITFGTVGQGETYPPIALDERVLARPDENLQPAFRPVR